MKFIGIDEVVNKFKNDYNVAIAGFGNFLVPSNLLKIIKNSYLTTNFPNNLNIITGVSAGDLSQDDVGLNIIAIPNLVKTITTAHMGMCKKMASLVYDNKIKANLIPFGVYFDILNASITNKKVITTTGINTFCDPRIDKSAIAKLINIDNQDYLVYDKFNIDVCLIKASIVDKEGNVGILNNDIITDSLDLTMATKANSGIVIIEADTIVDKLDSSNILIPNILIDYIVIVEKEEKNEDVIIDKIDNKREIIAKRASLELTKNAVINIGVGMPDAINKYINKEDNIKVSLESGFIGGKILTNKNFGMSINYDTRLKMSEMLKLYNSPFLDIAFLGAAQIDKQGNVNVSKFNGRTVGPGGFIDIVSNAKKIVFLTSLVTKNNDAKFKEEIEQITFASTNAINKKQTVLYVTEVCVFKLTNDGISLIEIQEGVDIEKEIINKMEFIPHIDASLLERKKRGNE